VVGECVLPERFNFFVGTCFFVMIPKTAENDGLSVFARLAVLLGFGFGLFSGAGGEAGRLVFVRWTGTGGMKISNAICSKSADVFPIPSRERTSKFLSNIRA
jgi:hypothetical protein